MMLLFDDVQLLNPGEKRFVDFQLPGADLRLWERFFEKNESDTFYRTLLQTTPWAQYRRKMYEKIVPDPRLTAWYGKNSTNDWTPELLRIKEKVESVSGIAFDSVLLNLYRDGNDSVSWHSDTIPTSGKQQAIGSVTFGETRVFKVRHKENKQMRQVEIPLTHGSFLLMGSTMQDYYEHHIPKTARKIGPRINLTFRVSDKQQ